MQKSTKIHMLLVILFISLFLLIPVEERNPNEINNTRLPQKSSVYYEDTTGDAYGVYVSGDYAYVADGSSGLAVIDISDPTDPGLPVYEDTTGSARNVYVSGDYAYIADWSSGLAARPAAESNPQRPAVASAHRSLSSFFYEGDL